MTWKGIKPIVQLVEGTYERNITLPKEALDYDKKQWHCSEALPKWDVTIIPT